MKFHDGRQPANVHNSNASIDFQFIQIGLLEFQCNQRVQK